MNRIVPLGGRYEIHPTGEVFYRLHTESLQPMGHIAGISPSHPVRALWGAWLQSHAANLLSLAS